MNTKTWTVWVGGGEVTDNAVTLNQARQIANNWLEKGYADTHIDNITWDSVGKDCKECGKELQERGEMDEYQLCHVCYCVVMDTTTNKEKSNEGK